LLDQLERINMELTQAREEKEMTMHAKSEREREAEHAYEQVKRIAKHIERTLSQVKSFERLLIEISAQYGLKAPLYNKKSRSLDSESPEKTLLEID